MRRTAYLSLMAVASATLLAACSGMPGMKSGMSFFVTSVNPGKGGDLGGLAGADRHCQALATCCLANCFPASLSRNLVRAGD